jgi:hypothetical protein
MSKRNDRWHDDGDHRDKGWHRWHDDGWHRWHEDDHRGWHKWHK